MTVLLTAAEMREIEQAAINSGGVTGLELMERAGAAVVEAVFEQWPAMAKAPLRAVVFCGPGNNGGDGFVIARMLKALHWEVRCYLYGDADRLPPDARANYERVKDLVVPWANYTGKSWGCDLLVDALFGTGLTRALPDFGELFWNMEDMVDCFAIEPGHDLGRPALVAVDIPSGICADSGRGFPIAEDHWEPNARVHMTVSFHRAKLGHYLADGPQACGKLVVKDIGLEAEVKPKEAARLVGAPHPHHLGKRSRDHKFSYGHALVLAGGVGHGGAARLAARGALRIGAGLVTVGCPPDALLENACQLTAVMLKEIADAQDFRDALKDARINALCIGPGLGSSASTRALVEVALLARRNTVVDADGLSAFLDAPKALFDLLHDACVLTPHGGEFARLFPDIALADLSKVEAVKAASARAGCVVLLKGADTVIATPAGAAAVHAASYDRSAPWLATAGSGDVLAGIIAGLLARGEIPFHAAQIGAWLHCEAARRLGPGLISEDIPEEIPNVFKALGVN